MLACVMSLDVCVRSFEMASAQDCRVVSILPLREKHGSVGCVNVLEANFLFFFPPHSHVVGDPFLTLLRAADSICCDLSVSKLYMPCIQLSSSNIFPLWHKPRCSTCLAAFKHTCNVSVYSSCCIERCNPCLVASRIVCPTLACWRYCMPFLFPVSAPRRLRN